MLFASAFLWGGCIATGLALPFNTAFLHFADVWVRGHPQLGQVLGPDAALLLAAPISAPIVEEISKALGVALIFWLMRAEFDNMRDGIVYGGLVGLGFNWFEAALYVAQGYAEYGVAPYGAELGARYALFGFGGHALFTALFGAFLGLGLQTRRAFGCAISRLRLGLFWQSPPTCSTTRCPSFLRWRAQPKAYRHPRISLRQACLSCRRFSGGTLLPSHAPPAISADHGYRGVAKRRVGTQGDPRRACR